MKKSPLLAALLFIAAFAQAQAPQAINYQALARNAQGQPMPNQNLNVEFSIHEGSISGNIVYREKHSVQSNAFGLFTLGIGQGTPQSGSFGAIDWAGAPKFLEVNINNTLQGTTQLLSVPYALYAARANETQTLHLNGSQLGISGGNTVTLPGSGGATTLEDLTDVTTTGVAPGQVLQWNGSQWTPINLPPGSVYTAGNGIQISGNTITNTGDTNPADDITAASQAGGDLSGPFSDLQIKPNAVGTPELADNAVNTAKIASGAVTGDKIAQQGAINGQVLKWNGTSWTPANDVGGGSGDNWGTQTVQTAGAALSGNGTAGSPLALAQQGAASGQVLKWNGTAWAPANDQNATVNAGTGISVSQNGTTFTVTNSAPDQPITLNGAGATAVSGTYPTFTITTPAPLDNSPTNELQTLSLNGNTLALSNGGGSVALPVSPTYGAGTGISINGPVINNTGDTNAADDITTGSAAGGDLSGTYPNPAVAKLQGKAVAATAPVDGDLLRYNGTSGRWEPVAGNTIGWGLKGNSGTDPAVNFVGTTDTQPVSFRVNGVERMKLWGDGRLELFGKEPSNTFVGEMAGNGSTFGFSNSFFGNGAGHSNTYGAYNTANGWQALFSNTFGSNNVAIGQGSLGNNTIGDGNTATGNQAIHSNTTGKGNTASGINALHGNTSGNNNTAIGFLALINNTIGNSNVAIGDQALHSNTTVSNLVAVGDSALFQNTGGISNTAIGSRTLFDNTSGSFNTASGYQTLFSNTTGNENSAYGVVALYSNTTGRDNSSLGNGSLYSNDSGDWNNAFGANALFSNITGSHNSAMGGGALYLNTTGSNNVAIGTQALYSNTHVSSLIAVGDSALYSNTNGFGNTAVGSKSLFSNTDANFNTALGLQALWTNTVGDGNTANGALALNFNTTGSFNTAIGNDALLANSTGWENTAVGRQSLLGNQTGHGNTCLGSYALEDNVYGSDNTSIGRFSGPNISNLSNSISLGSSAIATTSNSARIGNTSVTSIGGQVNWTAFSDGRFKTGVQEDVQGLDFIRRLRPVTYRYDIAQIDDFLGIPERRQEQARAPSPEELDAQRKAAGIRYSGFIAQEVEQTARELGYDFSGVDAPDNDKDPYGLRYAEFTVPLVKAVQEQQAMIEAQQNQLKDLNEQVQALMKEVQALKDVRAKGTEK